MVKKIGREEKLSFLQHLEELRKRIIRIVLFLIVAFTVTWNFSEKLILPFSKLLGAKLVFLTPMEALMAYMTIAFYAALFLTVPYLAYHVWAFVSPGLREKEKKYAVVVVSSASGLFFAGLVFCWYLVLPFMIGFLMSYGGDVMTPMISVKAYMSFCLSILLIFGAIFELPLVVVIIHSIGLVSLAALKDFRRYWIVAAFVIAAIITPTPDVFNQTITAIPMIVLYELSLVWIYLFGRKKPVENN
ncbi:MAG: twin-arginine translocase subunit TatC [Nitrospinae bacterium]|nr:twin-arginine translocase subunit TatC [Nitrospinota bacterium]